MENTIIILTNDDSIDTTIVCNAPSEEVYKELIRIKRYISDNLQTKEWEYENVVDIEIYEAELNKKFGVVENYHVIEFEY